MIQEIDWFRMSSQSLRELLKSKLTKTELKLLPRAFDTIGKIAVFSDFPDGLRTKEKIIKQHFPLIVFDLSG